MSPLPRAIQASASCVVFIIRITYTSARVHVSNNRTSDYPILTHTQGYRNYRPDSHTLRNRACAAHAAATMRAITFTGR